MHVSFTTDEIIETVQPKGVRGSTTERVRGIAALGASLGICMVGEGIGTTDDLARIHAEGCGSVQGYLPSKGLPEDEIPELIARCNTPGTELGRLAQQITFSKDPHARPDLQPCLLQS